jgi:glycosyl hydrolase family 99
VRERVLVAVCAAALVASLPAAAAQRAVPRQPGFPLRAAFYYPWFPGAWRQKGLEHYSLYTPTLGYYSSGDPNVIRSHVRAMLYGGIHAGIASWWGRGDRTDLRLPQLLSVTAAMKAKFWWTIYYEPEGQGNPSVAQIRSDLRYIHDRYANKPNFLHVGKRFVVFVYADANDGCATAERWKAANTVGAYVVLKVFAGFRTCDAQPQGWHQYAPASPTQDFAPWSYTISPGFAKADETSARLARDPARWQSSIRQMVASHARFQLVTTFNEWGEGTAVESAQQWSSQSGYGTYLDALHANGGGTSPPTAGDPLVVAVGDIACDPTDKNFNGGTGTAQSCKQLATSDLALALQPTAVLTLGDTQYEDNTYAKYLQSFGLSWGRLKPLIRPTVGNHEYLDAGAGGYFKYFGPAAGDPAKGYYSYDLGTWHVLSLNSECSYIRGCGAGSAEETWVRADLAAHPSTCVLAYWHEPRFSSGEHGDATQMGTIWNDLVAAHADVVLSGHNHDYERFDPVGTTPTSTDKAQNPVLDANGIREFVVGTGGKNHYPFARGPLAGEVVRNADTYGVLQLTLHPSSYDWRFVPEPGKTFSDAGTGSCH